MSTPAPEAARRRLIGAPPPALAALAALALTAGAGCDGVEAGRDGGLGDAAVDAGVPPRVELVDETGGVLILRGTNVQDRSKRSPDFLPPDYVTEADFARLSDELGMNVVRFLVFWEAVEPERGRYDRAYLAEVRARVQAAAAAGLWVIVDMHQDVFGRGFGHDGAPKWACDEALYASFSPPEGDWFLGYFEPEVAACFDRLWLDEDTRAAYGAMWAVVAEELRGTDGLLAYELMNEPFWGNIPLRQFEREIAPAAYAEWIDAIRAVDPEPYVMIGPASSANIGLGSDLVPPDRPRLIYGPHLYPAGLERGMGWSGDEDTVAALSATIAEDARRMALPALIGETGGRQSVPGVPTFLRQLYDALDVERLGVIQWEAGVGPDGSYALFSADGAPSELARAIARPFPARTAGEPIAWSWDDPSRTFSFDWRQGAGLGETRVTIPSLVYPSGAEALLEDGGAARIEGSVAVVPAAAGLDGSLRRLTVRPL